MHRKWDRTIWGGPARDHNAARATLDNIIVVNTAKNPLVRAAGSQNATEQTLAFIDVHAKQTSRHRGKAASSGVAGRNSPSQQSSRATARCSRPRSIWQALKRRSTRTVKKTLFAPRARSHAMRAGNLHSRLQNTRHSGPSARGPTPTGRKLRAVPALETSAAFWPFSNWCGGQRSQSPSGFLQQASNLGHR
jgi:hypothetical protein